MMRLRRLRKNAETRRLFAEVSLEPRHLVQPYFIVPDTGVKREVARGLWQLGPDALVEEWSPLARAGVGGIMLFGVPADKKAPLADQLGPLVDAVKRLKDKFPDTPVFADVCLCSYTAEGHCGLVKNGRIDNDATLPVLTDMAVRLARAGVDFVSPSDMMDGRVAAIRQGLDEAGLGETGILTYAVKMASAFYGPFRAAADSAPQFGDRTTYQMPAGNRREARREWQLDVEEGADALLVKPALTNLDIIRDCRERSDLPIFAYQVSGEYAVLKVAAEQGMLDFTRACEETLVSMRRAGADVLVSYYAREWLRR